MNREQGTLANRARSERRRRSRAATARVPRVAAASYEAYREQRFFASLDGLRCLSIVAVIWHHAGVYDPSIPISTRGFLGVDMFFVLSGFLIVTLLLRERERRGSIALRAFYLRRALRIFPLYYAVALGLAATFLFIRPESRLAEPFLHELPFHLTYTSNWIAVTSVLGISWSLAAEEQFYLAWPPIERYLARFALPILALVVAVNQALNFRLVPLSNDTYASLRILHSTFTPICLGVGLAHLLHARRGYERFARLFGARWAVLVFAGTLLLLLCDPRDDIGGWPRLAMQIAMAGMLGACVVREENALSRILCWAPVQRIGVVSYGMYLLHLFAMHGVEILTGRFDLHVAGLRFVLTLAATWLAAEISFRCWETPFLRLKTRFERVSGPTRLP